MRNRKGRNSKPSTPIDEDAQPPGLDHNKSAFVNLTETGSFVVHRVGPLKECEKIYGPFPDVNKARSKLSEYVEHFVREHSNCGSQLHFKNGDNARVIVKNYQLPPEVHTKPVFFFAVKPIAY